MQRRFGLRFEVMTRQFVARKQQAHGFGVNPWATHNRFIVSHALLRRPDTRDRLLLHLGARARKGLLILDEAHAAAPASASRYATDTELTATIRDLAPRFDNRLFLSATPHNGHSNSFSALLELLDPARFSRGVKIDGKRDLAPVMVRRLKRDLRKLGIEQFPKRVLVEIELVHDSASTTWLQTRRAFDAETGREEPAVALPHLPGPPHELELSTLLARYTALSAPASGSGRLPFIHLQQRLLSSPAAFARTLEAHASTVERRGLRAVAVSADLPVDDPSDDAPDLDPELHGTPDDDEDAHGDDVLRRDSAPLPSPTEEARALLARMRDLADAASRGPDAKVLAVLAWLREHLCPAAGLGPDTSAARTWAPRRVILFTEYTDTLRYWSGLLRAAIRHTDDADARIRTFHGGMGDDAREEVQRDFNADPHESPLRILLATDAAREGVNLQGACADLFHLDLPWNPSRLEQRNGRIDRTLQPAPEVRCHYFALPQRVEDPILRTVLRKIHTVETELGSLGAVVLTQLERALEPGLTAETPARLARVDAVLDPTLREAAATELESHRDDLETIQAEVARAGARLDASRRDLAVDPDSLRGVVDIGLALAKAPPLAPHDKTSDGKPTFTLPPSASSSSGGLDASWDPTLDTLRPPRERDQAFYEWRRVPPRPVTFHPLTKLQESAEQLHLAHPFVKRILDRFLAQGFSAYDLSRVSAVLAPDESVIRVVCFARLTLFSPTAARLHDQIVPIAAAWQGGADALDVRPYKDRATSSRAVQSVERLLAQGARSPNETIAARIRTHAPALFLALWSALEAEADALAADAKRGLAERARRESDDLERILRRQEKALTAALRDLRQAALFRDTPPDALRAERRQLELDLRHLEGRLTTLAGELHTEPEAVRALYEVGMQRITPVGLVVAWPEAMS
jgi:hypothetical protein